MASLTDQHSVTDQLINPVTLDYVRTANGEWEETADSRTTVLIMLETELGASPLFPDDGTQIKALLRSGEPVTPEVLLAETLRAGQILARAGVLADLTAEVRDPFGDVLRDESGRAVIRTHWRDLASGSPVDLALALT